MSRYGKAFRERAVSWLLPPESATIDVVANDTGVSSDTLERWRNEVLAEPARQTTWTAAARLESLITVAAFDETAPNAWCREHGVYPAFPLLNLAVAGAAFYTAHFFIVGLSAVILGNPITLRHWLAIIVGFSGLLLVVRPFGTSFTPAILLPIGGALCYSLAAIITRAKCHSVDVGLQALWLNIGFLILGV